MLGKEKIFVGADMIRPCYFSFSAKGQLAESNIGRADTWLKYPPSYHLICDTSYRFLIRFSSGT